MFQALEVHALFFHLFLVSIVVAIGNFSLQWRQICSDMEDLGPTSLRTPYIRLFTFLVDSPQTKVAERASSKDLEKSQMCLIILSSVIEHYYRAKLQ